MAIITKTCHFFTVQFTVYQLFKNLNSPFSSKLNFFELIIFQELEKFSSDSRLGGAVVGAFVVGLGSVGLVGPGVPVGAGLPVGMGGPSPLTHTTHSTINKANFILRDFVKMSCVKDICQNCPGLYCETPVLLS